jgi:hypothetical protein
LNKNKLLLGTGFCLIGVFSFLNYLGIISVDVEIIIAVAFILYSVITVYISLGSGDRASLVFSTILFLVGVIYLVKSHYQITDTRGTIFSSILFISGAVMFILFIENPKEKKLLVPSISMFILSIASIIFFKNVGLFNLVNKVANLFDIIWPVLLIVLGISIFINRKK